MSVKKIKVLHAIRQGTFGGGETYLYNLVSGLDENHFESVVLSFSEGKLVDQLRGDGIRTHVIDTKIPFNAARYPAVAALLRRERIDLLHIHGTRAGSNTLIPAMIQRIPAIYTVHGWSFHEGESGLSNLARIGSEKFLSRNADVTVCGSRANQAEGRRILIKPAPELIRNAIPVGQFTPGGRNGRLRAELGFSDAHFVVGFVGRVTYQKDPVTFIKAIPPVIATMPHARFLMVGDGDLMPACRDLIGQLNIGDYVATRPFSSEVASVLAALDVFVLPSRWEVLSLALMEAMAMEKACIATNIASNQELITNYRNGLLFHPGSAGQLAEQIIWLEKNGANKRQMEVNARCAVLEDFDFKRVVTETESLYVRLVPGRVPGARVPEIGLPGKKNRLTATA